MGRCYLLHAVPELGTMDLPTRLCFPVNQKKGLTPLVSPCVLMVGTTGFEPATSASRREVSIIFLFNIIMLRDLLLGTCVPKYVPKIRTASHVNLVLFFWIKSSKSRVSRYIFRPPGKRTTGISPAHILSLMPQTVRPSHAAASLSGKSLGTVGLQALCITLAAWFCRFCLCNIHPPQQPKI